LEDATTPQSLGRLLIAFSTANFKKANFKLQFLKINFTLTYCVKAMHHNCSKKKTFDRKRPQP